MVFFVLDVLDTTLTRRCASRGRPIMPTKYEEDILPRYPFAYGLSQLAAFVQHRVVSTRKTLENLTFANTYENAQSRY